MTKPDYSLIWGQNSPLSPYQFTSENYLQGWNFIGSTPPSRSMFDAWMKSADTKMKWLCDNAMYADEVVEKIFEHNTSETAHEDIRTAIAEATKKAGLPVGFEYTIPYTELQAGQLPLLGGKYLKSTYTDLWAWVQTHPSLLKTETEWQTLKTASGGRAVPKYADVDDQYFRVPLVTTWVRGASSVDEVGAVLEAGLPNITGSITNIPDLADGPATASVSGGLDVIYVTSEAILNESANRKVVGGITLDASKSNAIYGKSTTVQPQSVVRLWVVQAFGTNSNVGNMDVSQVAQGITDLTTRVSTLEANEGITILYPNGGTKEAPANITVNSRYVMDSPFPGYEVNAKTEVKINGTWYELTKVESSVNYYGAITTQLNNELVLVTAEVALVYPNMCLMGMALPPGSISSNIVTAPCRVKVWKVGKI